MKPILKSLWDGGHRWQLVVGIPAALLLFLGWPWILDLFDADTGTFTVGLLELPIVGLLYTILNSTLAIVGAKLTDDQFTRSTTSCAGRDYTFWLFLLYFCCLTILEVSLLVGGSAA